ncbi:hypothetical protein AURDEDRAFT_178387 [Auricularia subglabra TFB-10046 SS5]|uniref:Uncharacterized protein n=1 Tax=Auricularia subglabra (strain TFB-10046 / SS5) TaxID=717982 RepID=J0WL93_AURST|nr:hypothetical protein AURDEDRAFT_178387 [Auricularia subglabra TFB-10046 SS5]
MSTANLEILRGEFCLAIAYQTLIRLATSASPAYLATWRGRTRSETPPESERSGYFAFRSEFVEVMAENTHILLTLYPDTPEPPARIKLISHLADEVWARIKDKGGVLKVAEGSHARGRALAVERMMAKGKVRE